MSYYEEITAKLERLSEDSDFNQKMNECSSLEELVQLCNEEGINVSISDLQAGFTEMNEETELDENSLEKIAGGQSIIKAVTQWIWKQMHRSNPGGGTGSFGGGMGGGGFR